VAQPVNHSPNQVEQLCISNSSPGSTDLVMYDIETEFMSNWLSSTPSSLSQPPFQQECMHPDR
jgi:hypothetical protein